MSFITVREAASAWHCSERAVQILCKKGRIEGAYKASGVWLLPENSKNPTALKEHIPPF